MMMESEDVEVTDKDVAFTPTYAEKQEIRDQHQF